MSTIQAVEASSVNRGGADQVPADQVPFSQLGDQPTLEAFRPVQ